MSPRRHPTGQSLGRLSDCSLKLLQFQENYARACARVMGSYSGGVPPIAGTELQLSAHAPPSRASRATAMKLTLPRASGTSATAFGEAPLGSIALLTGRGSPQGPASTRATLTEA